jgi:hypothetical protein
MPQDISLYISKHSKTPKSLESKTLLIPSTLDKGYDIQPVVKRAAEWQLTT